MYSYPGTGNKGRRTMATLEDTTLTTHMDDVLERHPRKFVNSDRRDLIRHAVRHMEAVPATCGALATWTPQDSTGRSPRDTYIVRHPESEGDIDWDAPNNIPLARDTFDMLWNDALRVLGGKSHLYVTDRVVGADPSYALPIRTVTDRALHALFTLNMFRAVPEEIADSVFHGQGFKLLVLPYDKVSTDSYEGRLRKLPDGRTSDMAIAMDFDRRLGVIYGSAYCGSVKKLMFTTMNHLLPDVGVLPLHCAANEGSDGSTALLLGLSGTGKTSLSADPGRALLGDDEHGWSGNGISNFENGCYAKLINLRADKEAEIFNAVFHDAELQEHGAIVENCMIYPDGKFDVDDERLTPNSRGSYPLEFLRNIKTPPVGGHPDTILFLTADANGVLPPVARLDANQAMLWFLMGYTSKLAGTERGVVDPVSTFSRFFGAPFMPRNPDVYATMLGNRLERYDTRVYLINTGWSGGPYGEGRRMDIALTRSVVNAALTGQLETVPYRVDPLFHFSVPTECPGVPARVLDPRNTWKEFDAYDRRALKLASEFAQYFGKAYGDKGIDPTVASQCPGV
jgi:phosphoenolpyruvate carboxykinase (ATP)